MVAPFVARLGFLQAVCANIADPALKWETLGIAVVNILFKFGWELDLRRSMDDSAVTMVDSEVGRCR